MEFDDEGGLGLGGASEVAPSLYAARPDSVKQLRACKGCKLIKTMVQFQTGACENCPRPEARGRGYLHEWTEANTTKDFEG